MQQTLTVLNEKEQKEIEQQRQKAKIAGRKH
jgi:hypothetical protein